MAQYDEVLIIKEKTDYSMKEKAAFFDEIWDTAKQYYDNYSMWRGDNDDEECDFRSELKQMATKIVFPHANEEAIIDLIDELAEENRENEK